MAGPARTDPAAHKHALARPKTRRNPSWLLPEPQQLAHGTHVTERQAGEEKDTAAKLIAGDSSGEVSGATAVNSLVRIYWCPQLKLLARLPGLAMSTAAHGRSMAGSGENSHGGGGRKRHIRPYQDSIGPTVRWRR